MLLDHAQDLDTLEQESSKTAAELQSSLEASQAEAAALKQQLEESVQVRVHWELFALIGLRMVPRAWHVLQSRLRRAQ